MGLRVGQLVEGLPTIHEALGSISSTTLKTGCDGCRPVIPSSGDGGGSVMRPQLIKERTEKRGKVRQPWIMSVKAA